MSATGQVVRQDYLYRRVWLIEDIYGGVHVRTMLRGDEVLRDKRKEQFDSIVKDGRLAMAEALGEDPA